ncbi:DUF1801 domain-containing protein [Cucumibacter marinus]|uniref:DUF1801 domain-containing protein n=1 Tax=Cucumibacter marinus TaxID=1121252 RepID=UPI0004920BC7|nr:DUF1801 domain-containing protein [Cucumibacter marinus]
MAKSQNKTQQTESSVADFLNAIEDDTKRADAWRIDEIMREITGEDAKMWGAAIVGYGRYHYKYESGREGDFMIAGFSPRKANLTLYIMAGFSTYEKLLEKLGKHKTGKSCLYVKRLSDIDESVLRAMIAESVAYMRDKYPTD